MKFKDDSYPYSKCLLFSSGALARSMNKIAEECFAKVEMSPSQAFVLLNVIKHPGITTGQLAKVLMLAPSTLTRLIEGLEKQGFAKRVAEGRTSMVFAKENAVLLKEKIEKCHAEMQKRYVDIIGARESKILADMNFKASLKMHSSFKI